MCIRDSDKGQLNGRDLKVLKLIKNFSNLKSNENNYSKRVLSLGLSKKGNPRHPLYMPNQSFLRRLIYNFELVLSVIF